MSRLANFTTVYPTDMIFQQISGSLTVSNGSKAASSTLPINMLASSTYSYPYFDGVYSIDNSPVVNRMSFKDGAATFGAGITASATIGINLGQPPQLKVSGFIPSTFTYPDNNNHTINWTVILYGSNTKNGIVTPSLGIQPKAMYDSSYKNRSIYLSGSIPFIASSSAYTASIPHNLGYKPPVRAFLFSQDSAVRTFDRYVDITENAYIYTIVDETNVTFTMDTDSWSTYEGSDTWTGQLEYRIYF